METITARLVADATVKTVQGNRQLTGFRVAVNHRYVAGGEKVEQTAYYDCAYWRNMNVAPYLTKGLLVQLNGHAYATAWIDREGYPRANMHFHVGDIVFLGASAANQQAPQKPRQKPGKKPQNNQGYQKQLIKNGKLQPNRNY